MSNSAHGHKVRLQIPVDTGLAEYLAKSAEILQTSQANLVELLVTTALENREKWLLCLAYRLGVTLSKAITGPAWQQQGTTAYVQAFLEPIVIKGMEELAKPLGHTVPRIAATLLDSAVWETDWLVTLFNTGIGQTLITSKRQQDNEAEKKQAASRKRVA